ncbi:MAG: DUF4974 domain-containing protein [Carboxylicivirga sp.]|nr:DUF4974 domain-containing protein [Carboxylicivirga sp.]
MKELNDIENLIIKSLDATANEDELKVLKDWIEASEDNKRHYFQFKDVWDASDELTDLKNKNNWNKLQKTIDRPVIKWGRELIKVAAVMALTALVSYALFNFPNEEEDTIALSKVVVPNGSKTTVHLADGTTVWLNAGSELVYPTVFNKESRNVELKGEGYFKVSHDAEHPFMVSAGEIEVKVLGTEFNVMAYPDAGKIETTLVEGSIYLNKKGATANSGIILKPGQKVTFVSGELKVAASDMALDINWMQKGFNFQKAPFDKIVTQLERWYDVDIVYNSKAFKDLTFTGKFRNNETIWQVLDVIKMTTPIDYKARDGKIYVNLINE